MNYELIREPLTKEQIRKLADEEGKLVGVIPIDLDSIIYNEYESFLDILSEKLIDSPLLMEMKYKIVGFEGEETLHLEITGYVSIPEEYEEEEQEENVLYE